MTVSEHSTGSRPDEAKRSPERGQASDTPASLHAHLAELRELLTADRERTSDRVLGLARNFSSIVEATQFTATDDEHDPEGSTIAFERSQTSALHQAAEDHVAEVDMALERIARGTYGRCEHCGEPVSLQRLLARPTARACITCAASTSRRR